MENKICQSCGMPIKSNEQIGTNKDGKIVKLQFERVVDYGRYYN